MQKGIVNDFADNTSAHGFARVKNSASLERFVYVICLMVLWSLMAYQTYMVIKSFLHRDTVTSLTVHHYPALTMPALTVCNHNPMKKSKLRWFIEQTKTDLLDSLERILFGNSTSQNSIGSSLESDMKENLSIAFYQHPVEASQTYGHYWEELVESSYQGKKDVMSTIFSIGPFHHARYGSCYTIVPKSYTNSSVDGHRTVIPGNELGLKLILFADNNETLGPLVPVLGMRMEVHPIDVAPIPEERGFSVSTGSITSIGLKKRQLLKNLDRAYSNCTHSTNSSNLYDNLANVKGSKGKKSYSRNSCMKSCIVEEIYLDKKCIKANMISRELIRKEWSTAKVCDGSQKMEIEGNVKYMQNCAWQCTTACNQTEFLTRITANNFPSNDYLMVKLVGWMQANPAFAKSLGNDVREVVGEDMASIDDETIPAILKTVLWNPELETVGEVFQVVNEMENRKVDDNMSGLSSSSKGPTENEGNTPPISGSYTTEYMNYDYDQSHEPELRPPNFSIEQAEQVSTIEYYQSTELPKTTTPPSSQGGSAADIKRSILEKIHNTIVGVELFYETMEVEVIEESPKMSVQDLLSNIGGTFGLFIGVSCVTILEFLCLCAHLACCCAYKSD